MDDFAADITRRARHARDHNDGDPEPAWSTGERLFTALVLRNEEYLAGEEWTVAEVTRPAGRGTRRRVLCRGRGLARGGPGSAGGRR